MKKFFKTIFSRFSIMAIMVILQVACIYLVFLWLDDYYFVAQIVLTVLSWIFLVTVSFRSMPAEGKLTWTVLILGFPPLGMILYIMFSKNFLSFRQKKIHDRLDIRKNMYNIKDEDYNEEMKAKMPLKYFGQMEYIYFASKQFGFDNTSTKYFSCGEEYFEELKKDLNKATKFIFIEFFIIEPGVFFDSILEILQQKIQNGVEVRLIYDDIGSINKVPFGYYSKLKKMGIKVVRFNRFVPVISAVHNNRDHRKIIVIDGKIGYTGGINLADEYINVTHPLKYWKDTGIKLTGQAVDELTLMFLASYDLQTRKVDSRIKKYLEQYDVEKQDGIVCPYGDGPRPAYNEYIGENVYINMINQAERYVWITTPYLVIDSKLVTALQNAASKGVDVRIFTPHVPDKKVIWMITRSFYEKLQRYGVKICEYEPGFIHAKMVLCDDEVGTIGTINFDYRSLLHHYENGVWMYNTKAIKEMKKDFEEDIIPKSIDMKNYKQNWILHIFCKIVEVFQPLL